MPIIIKPLFGTALKGEVGVINNSPEHRRIGLEWSIIGGYLEIKDGPFERANLANAIGVLEEVADQLASCGVNVQWPRRDGGYMYFSVRPGKVTEMSDWPE